MTTEEGATHAIDGSLLDVVRRFIRSKILSSQDIDDIANETILRLLRARGATGRFHVSYIFKTVNNIIFDKYRSSKVRRFASETSSEYIKDVIHISGDVADPEQRLLGREAVYAVFDALDQLSPRTKEVFLLYRVDGLSHRDIAVQLNISVSAVEKHVSRAAMHLAMRVDLT